MSSRETNDPETERERSLENNPRKREAYKKAAEEVVAGRLPGVAVGSNKCEKDKIKYIFY